MFANLLDYLRRRPDGFELLCHALMEARQDFLAETLKKTRDTIPEVGP